MSDNDLSGELYLLADDAFLSSPRGRQVARWVRGHSALALSHAVALGARVVDNVIGAIGNDATAREEVDDRIPLADQASMLAAWGDRPSALAWIVSGEAILESIREQCQYEFASAYGKIGSERRALFAATVIRGLARELHERADWDEILDLPVSDWTLRDLLIAAVGNETGQIDEDGNRFRDTWTLVGLDPDDAERRLRELDPDVLLLVSGTNLWKVRRDLAERREAAGLPANVGSADDA